MAWRLLGDKPLSEPMLTWFTHAYMQLWGRIKRQFRSNVRHLYYKHTMTLVSIGCSSTSSLVRNVSIKHVVLRKRGNTSIYNISSIVAPGTRVDRCLCVFFSTMPTPKHPNIKASQQWALCQKQVSRAGTKNYIPIYYGMKLLVLAFNDAFWCNIFQLDVWQQCSWALVVVKI